MHPDSINSLIEIAIAIQQIPAPTFNENERAEFMRDRFQRENLVDISIDEIGNVYARLPGSGSSKPILVSAHLDTVFPLNTDLGFQQLSDKISAPGIGDNAIGLAGLIGLVWILNHRRTELNSDLWLVANVGEEGLGDLRGMKAIVDRFAGLPQAYIILEGMALGQIYHRGLGVHRYRITVTTSGGHSWVDHGKPSAIHELAQIVNRILAIKIPEQPRTTLNVGVIKGGISVNTIAAEAHLDLDLRSEDESTLTDLVNWIDDIVDDSNRPDVQVKAETIGQRPIGNIPRNHPLVKLAAQSLKSVGIQPRLNIGSTDANIPLSSGYPAVCLGLTTGSGAHTLNEYVHIAPLQLGLQQLISVVEGIDAAKDAD
jgi:acetylornithine deacetylase/succinyl-diaminopimelate desuccinylase-like protein